MLELNLEELIVLDYILSEALRLNTEKAGMYLNLDDDHLLRGVLFRIQEERFSKG